MKKNFLLIGLLSLFPSMGQFYNKEYKKGIVLFVITIVGYYLFTPLGFIFHTLSFSEAIIDKNKIEKENLYMFS
jgi:uncharacterized membrane protein